MGALHTLNDDELYALFSKGNEEAFAFLYKRYWKRLLVKARTKVSSDMEAEEIVQSVLLDLWRSGGKREITRSFSIYVAAMLKYKIMAHLAASYKRAYINDEIAQNGVDHSTQEWLDFRDLQQEIEKHIEDLPEKCRIVFRMSRNEGLTNRQIADKLQVSEKNIEAHIHKALKSLRLKLKHFFFLLF